jgi:hypothetical protein
MADALRESARERELERQFSWMSDVDKHMLETGLTPIPGDQFGGTVWRKGEKYFKAVEQRRFEEGTFAPGPGNDVMMGSSIVVWSATTISALRTDGWADWPAATSGKIISGLYSTLPKGATVDLILETLRNDHGLRGCVVSWVG